MPYAIQKRWELLLIITALVRFFGRSPRGKLVCGQRNSKTARDMQMQAVHAQLA